MPEVAIRGEGGEFLTISLSSRSHPEATDYWDGNWIIASVEVQAGGFRGSVGGHLRTEELATFYGHLARVQESLRGAAEFTTIEGWLSIRVDGDGRGHMKCTCVILYKPGVGNTF